MKLAFFDTKSYDIPGFDRYALPAGIHVKYFEPNLSADTAALAAGFDAVCVFVNDIVDAAVVEKLHALGVKAIVLRGGSAGMPRKASGIPRPGIFSSCSCRARHGTAPDRKPAYS